MSEPDFPKTDHFNECCFHFLSPPSQITTSLVFSNNLGLLSHYFYNSGVQQAWLDLCFIFTRPKSRSGQGRIPFWGLCGRSCLLAHVHCRQNSVPCHWRTEVPVSLLAVSGGLFPVSSSHLHFLAHDPLPPSSK